jgi:hypothetical protein
MPTGADVTVPLPRPDRVTVNLSMVLMVSNVLVVFPALSVTLIVVTPRPRPVASPVAEMLAAVVLLLLHVRPVPLTFTGTDESSVSPLPS